MQASKVALIVIYNHKYDKNIDLLESLYKGRFSTIYHLVPFYTGTKTNVIPVYENSYYFQGYITQGLKSFYSKDIVHYFFVADDMIINPEINENNYADFFKLDENSSFIPKFCNLYHNDHWPHKYNGFSFRVEQYGIEVTKELPDYQEAEKRLISAKAIERPLEQEPSLKWPEVYEIPGYNLRIKENLKGHFRRFLSFIQNRKYRLTYPLVASYSDILVVSSQNIKEFCHYCGVFTSLKLFVEIAIPTALALSSNKIVTENELVYEEKALWRDAVGKFLSPYKNNLELLIKNYPEKVLYIHPVKLSQWDCSILNK